jgi:hypothetical protein
MATLLEWFDAFTEDTGERPTHIVLGQADYRRDGGDTFVWYDGTDSDIILNKLLSFPFLPMDFLEKEFDDGYGGTEAPDLIAWSRNWVIFLDVYDGAESMQWVPKNPKSHTPIRPGG